VPDSGAWSEVAMSDSGMWSEVYCAWQWGTGRGLPCLSYSTHLQNLKSAASSIPKILKEKEFKICGARGKVCCAWQWDAGHGFLLDPFAKFHPFQKYWRSLKFADRRHADITQTDAAADCKTLPATARFMARGM